MINNPFNAATGIRIGIGKLFVCLLWIKAFHKLRFSPFADYITKSEQNYSSTKWAQNAAKTRPKNTHEDHIYGHIKMGHISYYSHFPIFAVMARQKYVLYESLYKIHTKCRSTAKTRFWKNANGKKLWPKPICCWNYGCFSCILALNCCKFTITFLKSDLPSLDLCIQNQNLRHDRSTLNMSSCFYSLLYNYLAPD